MSTSIPELSSSDWQIPLVPFEQLAPYHGEEGLYELDTRPEGSYRVVLLFRKVGEEALLLTRIEKDNVRVVDVLTPNDQGLDRLHHIFPSVSREVSESIFRVGPVANPPS